MVTGFWGAGKAVPAFFQALSPLASRALCDLQRGSKSQLLALFSLYALASAKPIQVKPFVYFMLVHILCSDQRLAITELSYLWLVGTKPGSTVSSSEESSLNGVHVRRIDAHCRLPKTCTDPYHILLGFQPAQKIEKGQRENVLMISISGT